MKQDSNEKSPQESSTIERFLAGLNECIFLSKLGVADVQLVDYLSELMLRFVRTEALHHVRKPNGTPATEVFQMVVEADRRVGLARREVHRHIGDFTLFWSGMYPESLRRMKPDQSRDGFVDYCQQGKRAYQIAAQIEAGDDRPSSDLLMRLSEQFELCAYGLREVRREWEEGDSGKHLLVS